MREERKLKVFENMVLRRVFGPRWDEVTGEWRRLYNEELSDEREVYGILVGKPEGKRPLGRPRRRWVDNIRMDLQEVVCGYMDWIGLTQDRERWGTLVSAVMNLRVP